MLKDITKVKPLKDFHLHLEFEDGAKGKVDIRKLVKFSSVFEPLKFEPLKDETFFAKVAVNPEWGTIFWPNGADLDPDVLYSLVTGEAFPEMTSVRGK
ncbi:MAG TPA: DUF2442 domain-containing protein [Anaerolineales bacterium]